MIGHFSKIGVMAPSSYIEREDIEASIRTLAHHGIESFIHPQTFLRRHQSAGTSQDKREALHSLYEDESIEAIWAAGGGNRALDLMRDLDFDLIARHPKPLIGYSDVTCLLNAIYARTGQLGIHGPNFKDLHKKGFKDAGSLPLNTATFLKEGQAEGPSIGGCLSLFHLLVGTDKCPVLEGAVLFLEDAGDHLSRFDRMFLDLKHKGVFEKIGGLVIGEFHDVQDGVRPFGASIEEIVIEAVSTHDIPVIFNAPFGHGPQNIPFPIGGQAVIDSTEKTLRFQTKS